jgi:hypothetical protein
MSNLKELISLCEASVHVTVNDHKSVYMSVAESIKEDEEIGGDLEIPKEVMDKMIELDTIIVVQAYPLTPIGHYVLYHYDIDTAIDLMIRVINTNN